MSVSGQKVLPYHIGFIVDGNRRWAKEKGLSTFICHKEWARRLGEIVRYAQDLGIKIVTIYACSTENYKRAKKEVSYLMKIFEDFVINKIIDIHKQARYESANLRRLSRVSRIFGKGLKDATRMTKNNKKMIVNVAINYKGRDELVRTFRKLVISKIEPENITEELVNQNLDTVGLSDPDIIIRTLLLGHLVSTGFLIFFPSKGFTQSCIFQKSSGLTSIKSSWILL